MASSDIAAQLDAYNQSYDPVKSYNNVTAQLGIPDARARVTNLQTQIANSENAIKNVDPSVTGRTQNSLVTEAQRQRLVNMERAPLTDTYNTQTKNYNTENSNLSSLLGEADKREGLEESQFRTRRQSLADSLDYAQKQEEIQRQQEQQAIVNSRAGGSSGGGGSSGNGSYQSQIKTGLMSVRGKDGYVSPQDFATAYDDWVKAGGSSAAFDKAMGQFRNPKNGYYSYAIKQLRG